jgi:hypothetical protein
MEDQRRIPLDWGSSDPYVARGRSAIAAALLRECRPHGRLGRLPMSAAAEADRTPRTVETVLTELERAGAIEWVRKRPGGRHRPWWSVKVLDVEMLRTIVEGGH